MKKAVDQLVDDKDANHVHAFVILADDKKGKVFACSHTSPEVLEQLLGVALRNNSLLAPAMDAALKNFKEELEIKNKLTIIKTNNNEIAN